MNLVHPKNPEMIAVRNKMLQKSLRPEPQLFEINAEYPIVLASKNTEYSYCFYEDQQIYSHANLWPRNVLGSSELTPFTIGLIGNVATAENQRGKGLACNLLNSIDAEARRKDLAALVLWSDLSEFYHKLGFESLGIEYHYSFDIFRSEPLTNDKIQRIESKNIDKKLLQRLMELRYPTKVTLERNLQDYQQLCTIPGMDLFGAWNGGILSAFAWVGKGADMIGVLHEWGGSDPKSIIDLSSAIGQHLGLSQTLLLSPYELDEAWHRMFLEESFLVERRSMALVKIIKETYRSSIEQMFIWGLDSI